MVASGTTLANNGEIVVDSGATLINNGTIENNDGNIAGSVIGRVPIDNPSPVFTVEHHEILDGANDTNFVINWNLASIKVLTINGNAITMTPNAGSVKRILSGYPGYTGNIGEVVSGSSDLTLYAPFIAYLATNESGQQTMTADYEAGNTTHNISTTFTAQPESNTPPPPGPDDPPGDDGEDSVGECNAGFPAAGLFALTLLSLSGLSWKTKRTTRKNKH
jgi:hypothetical protein